MRVQYLEIVTPDVLQAVSRSDGESPVADG